jgi:hypothetical protein
MKKNPLAVEGGEVGEEAEVEVGVELQYLLLVQLVMG